MGGRNIRNDNGCIRRRCNVLCPADHMVDAEKYLNRTGLIHIAFSVGSKERVDEITQLLQTDGYHIVSGPRTTGDGYYESCVAAIENNQIEFSV
jgi:lactoylglutathione lyase